MLQKGLHSISLFRLQILLVKQLPVKHVPGHELICLPGEAACAVDQSQSGEASDEEGSKLHSSGVDVFKLWRQTHTQKLHNSVSVQNLDTMLA